jgi:hypothetical protein
VFVCVLRIERVRQSFTSCDNLKYVTFLFHTSVSSLYRVSQEERSIFCEVIISAILRKSVYMNMCPIPNGFRYLAPIVSFPPTAMRHWLKRVNRCEASVGCCDGKYCAPNSKYCKKNIGNHSNRTHVHINLFFFLE